MAEAGGHPWKKEQLSILDVSPLEAFDGSKITLEVRASRQLEEDLYKLKMQSDPPFVTFIVDGREAKLLKSSYPFFEVRIPEEVSSNPTIRVQFGQFTSESFRRLTLFKNPTEVIPNQAQKDAIVTLVTGSEIPHRLRAKILVLVDGNPVHIDGYTKTGIKFRVPEIDLGPASITYKVEGVVGSSEPVMLEVISGPSWFRENLMFFVSGLAIFIMLLATTALYRRFRLSRSRIERWESSRSYLDSAIKPIDSALRLGPISVEEPVIVEKLVIKNFKNIRELELDLSAKSTLEGSWTCIAGINGSGKSSILQAICLLLLGERLAPELGSERLRRMMRREGEETFKADLQAWVRIGNSGPIRLHMPLGKNGVDEPTLHSDKDYDKMRFAWERLRHFVLVSYGAARNLSEVRESRYDGLADQVRRQMTLFDPLTRIAGVDVLLEGAKKNERTLKTLHRLLQDVMGQDDQAAGRLLRQGRLVFGPADVDAIDLPDGFRATVAWLADLCSAWHETAKEYTKTNPADITGIVLLDEIGLHLHPSLARSIVPMLRQALPKVQFIVTTHSPLVISSFDREELIVLESDQEGRIGKRRLDRQVFGFSMNEVYKFLMKTKPHSSVLEQKALREDDEDLAKHLYQSEETSESDAQILVDDMARLLKKVKADEGKE
jgi:hypothetical protein